MYFTCTFDFRPIYKTFFFVTFLIRILLIFKSKVVMVQGHYAHRLTALTNFN